MYNSTIDFKTEFTSNQFVAFMNNFKQIQKEQMEDEKINEKEEESEYCSNEQYLCDDCDKVFDESSKLFAHHIQYHEHRNEQISYDCANCYRSFPKHFLFMKHIKYIQKEEEITCNYKYKLEKAPEWYKEDLKMFLKNKHDYELSDSEINQILTSSIPE